MSGALVVMMILQGCDDEKRDQGRRQQPQRGVGQRRMPEEAAEAGLIEQPGGGDRTDQPGYDRHEERREVNAKDHYLGWEHG